MRLREQEMTAFWITIPAYHVMGMRGAKAKVSIEAKKRKAAYRERRTHPKLAGIPILREHIHGKLLAGLGRFPKRADILLSRLSLALSIKLLKRCEGMTGQLAKNRQFATVCRTKGECLSMRTTNRGRKRERERTRREIEQGDINHVDRDERRTKKVIDLNEQHRVGGASITNGRSSSSLSIPKEISYAWGAKD
jgi:hypothetical protein